jgi:hypothetical protein
VQVAQHGLKATRGKRHRQTQANDCLAIGSTKQAKIEKPKRNHRCNRNRHERKKQGGRVNQESHDCQRQPYRPIRQPDPIINLTRLQIEIRTQPEKENGDNNRRKVNKLDRLQWMYAPAGETLCQ